MIQPLKNAIVDVVKGLESGSAKSFAAVYDGETENFDGYPSAVVTFDSSDAEIYTTTQNKRTYNFKVEIWYSTTVKTQSKAREVVNNLSDRVITAIEHDTALNNLIKIMMPVLLDEQEILNAGQGLAIMQSMTISVVLLE